MARNRQRKAWEIARDESMFPWLYDTPQWVDDLIFLGPMAIATAYAVIGTIIHIW